MKPPEWTEGRYRAFLVAVLRSGMRRWPPKWRALQDACIGQVINPKTKKKAKMYRCATCCELFVQADVQVDHRNPVVESTGFTTWDNYIDRLFCLEDNLQILCKLCHKVKTRLERESKCLEAPLKKPTKKATSSTPSTVPKKSSKRVAHKSSSKVSARKSKTS